MERVGVLLQRSNEIPSDDNLPATERPLPSNRAQSSRDDCPECGGIGWVRYDVPVDHELFGKLVPCDACGPGRKTDWLKRLCRLRGELAQAQLQDWKPLPGVERVIPTVIGYLKRSGRGDDRKACGWITLSGPNGTGKSHLLAALVNHYIESGRPAIYITMRDLLQELRQSYEPNTETIYSQLWRDITEHAEVLAIDDIERFSGTSWAQEQVVALLGHRYERKESVLTILATNVDCRQELFTILPEGNWPAGYVESRMLDGRNVILSDFWNGVDVRPSMVETFPATDWGDLM